MGAAAVFVVALPKSHAAPLYFLALVCGRAAYSPAVFFRVGVRVVAHRNLFRQFGCA